MSTDNNKIQLTEKQLLAMPDNEYMNLEQREYFRHLLMEMQSKLKSEIDAARVNMHAPSDVGDSLDLASSAEMMQLSLRTTERKTKLLHKVEEALIRVDSGTYGYCVETGQAIGLKRLLARPTATLSIDSKEQQEFHERTEGKSDIGAQKEGEEE